MIRTSVKPREHRDNRDIAMDYIYGIIFIYAVDQNI